MRARIHLLWAGVLAAAVAAAAPTPQPTTPPTAASQLTPEQTVERYLAALKAGDYETAWKYITRGMAQNKDQKKWAEEMQLLAQMTEVKIFGYHVYPGKVQGDKAFVPNILSSQDKYLNQLGVEEHELYTLVREDGRWKIDQQQIVERSELSKWFPAEVSGEP